jgi:SAM-dependent methyltransferase
MDDYLALRSTFDSVASLYHEIRPRYPDALFSTLIKVTDLLPGHKILEIGSGTGQATKPLAMLGYNIIGIELGAALASVAAHELRSYPNVNIMTGAFEDIDMSQKSFDLIIAATSFHWIRPEVKFTKSSDILKNDKYLAIIHTHHISDEQGDVFFKASLPVFARFNFIDTPEPSLPLAENIRPAAIDEKLFRLTHFQCFRVINNYTGEEFSKLLNTYSNHLAATKDHLDEFLYEIKALINREFNGSIKKHFLMSLTIAQKINT